MNFINPLALLWLLLLAPIIIFFYLLKLKRREVLVSSVFLVAAGDFDRIAGIAELEEVHALDDPAAIDVETGDDPLGQHRSEPALIHGTPNTSTLRG